MSDKNLPNTNRQYVIGTAGHIDHGKTALVKALTGVDTDRLPEERSRGITIDIGFAHLSENITIIDVPGHERLIRNMVAGVSTIDLVVFVVAADDGVMPQSREHLDIINLLQIRQGIFVITKCDLADEDWLKLVEEDIRGLLKDTPFKDVNIVRTSATTGEGIEALKALILEKLAALSARQDFEVYRQPVDRVFSAKGFGTVITGTVLSGKLKLGDTVEVQPGGTVVRVRGLQTHDKDVEKVDLGYRAAVNLAGVEKEDVSRGMVLTRPESYQAVEIINARIRVLKSAAAPIKNNQRVRIHIHTAETFARIIFSDRTVLKKGESAYAQLRLEDKIHVAFQDRFIIRQFSPQRTLGGGLVLQTNPFRFRKKYAPVFQRALEMLESDELAERINGALDPLNCLPLSLWQLKLATNSPLSELQQSLKALAKSGLIFSESIGGKTHYFSRQQLETVTDRLVILLNRFHEAYPGRAGMSEAELASSLEKQFTAEAVRRALSYAVQQKKLAKDDKTFRMAAFAPELSSKDSETYKILIERYETAFYAPPTLKDMAGELDVKSGEFKELIKILRTEGILISVAEGLLFHKSVIPALEKQVQDFFAENEEMTVAQFKELTGTTRKHSIPLLTYLDRKGVTQRDGDIRRRGHK